jgi:SAM-dependent methyltransferase
MPDQPDAHRPYDPAHFEPLARIEDRHFWFRARNRVIEAVIRPIVAGLPRGYRVLEVGCGTGNVLRVLDRACREGTVVGMDLFAEGLRFARGRTRRPLVQGDVRTPPFRAPFDVIGAFDVLEHLPNDLEVMQCLRAMLKPGGTFLVTVPAHPSLWSYFDEASNHVRRYTPEALRTRLAQSGFEVEFLTQYMASIYPLVWLQRRLRQSAATDRERLAGELKIIPVLNGLLTGILALESRLIAHRRRLPIGTSLLAVARPTRPAPRS